IGEAISPSHYHYWHTTGTVGAFGAAVAAGVILKLDAERMVWALGSAGTQASGLWEFLIDGAMSKQLHPAKAAVNGLLAALLAHKGFTAATRILEGEKGFIRATAPEFNLDRITDGLERGMTHYRIQGVSFKIHASCRHTHPAIDAALALVKQHNLLPEDVEAVKALVYSGAMDLLGKVEVTSPFSAKFSMPYCLATAIVHRDAGLSRFTEAALANSQTRALMQRVTLEVDPELDRLYPQKWAQSVEIRTRSGKLFRLQVDFPKGDPENPLTPGELRAKFYALTMPFLPRQAIDRYVDRIAHLDELPDMNDFVRPAS
ncbi:MAG: MmgE/PrpD family protein, partial [Dehalococcoidia bacterium]|nr:MmgE/PrpD family protein [Dehalococcoidia bacterium]